MNNALKTLLEEKWVIKSVEKESYAEVKRALNELKSLLNEKLGWRIIHNENLIKLEKIPATPRPFMGIEEFSDILDYQILCALLIFLEDREEKSQFLLSTLTNHLQVLLKDYVNISWTDFATRKSLVRVLTYAESINMIESNDGNSDDYLKDKDSEVLYINTGVSRFFAINYPFDVKETNDYKDFNKLTLNQDDETGDLRTIRVYRELVTSPAYIYNGTNHTDAIYLRNKRNSIDFYLNKFLDGELYLSKNMASLVYLDTNPIGDYYPKDNALSDIVMGVCNELSAIAYDQRSSRFISDDDCFYLSAKRFEKIIIDFKNENGEKFSKEYRELNNDRFIIKVKKFMKDYLMIEEENEEIKIFPSINLVKGRYRG